MEIGDVVTFTTNNGTKRNFGVIAKHVPNTSTYHIRAFFGPTINFTRRLDQIALVCKKDFLFDRLLETAGI